MNEGVFSFTSNILNGGIYMIWFIIIGILLIIVEILTPTIFFFFAFGISFILNSIVFYLSNSIPLSLFTTLVTTVFVFYYIKKKNLFKSNSEYKSNISSYIGKSCIIEDVLPNNFYRIKIFSEVWTAKSEETLNKGEYCKVFDRVDNTLIIKKQ